MVPHTHTVHLRAPETLVPFPTEELLRRYHPATPLRRPLPGRTAPIDTTAARRLLGFTARRLLDAALTGVTAYDTEFTGYGGDRVHAWLLIPAGCPAPMPCVVHYLGYGAGRGLPHDHLVWPAAGRAVLVMDTRGQGAADPHSAGATGDPHGAADPQAPGFVTRGILDPGQYSRAICGRRSVPPDDERSQPSGRG
ncbi:acetylxylan esterase [Streptomyces scopuliridis]